MAAAAPTWTDLTAPGPECTWPLAKAAVYTAEVALTTEALSMQQGKNFDRVVRMLSLSPPWEGRQSSAASRSPRSAARTFEGAALHSARTTAKRRWGAVLYSARSPTGSPLDCAPLTTRHGLAKEEAEAEAAWRTRLS